MLPLEAILAIPTGRRSGSRHPQPYVQNFTIPGEHLSVISNTLLGDMGGRDQYGRRPSHGCSVFNRYDLTVVIRFSMTVPVTIKNEKRPGADPFCSNNLRPFSREAISHLSVPHKMISESPACLNCANGVRGSFAGPLVKSTYVKLSQ